jgi:hypothetical protein
MVRALYRVDGIRYHNRFFAVTKVFWQFSGYFDLMAEFYARENIGNHIYIMSGEAR